MATPSVVRVFLAGRDGPAGLMPDGSVVVIGCSGARPPRSGADASERARELQAHLLRGGLGPEAEATRGEESLHLVALLRLAEQLG